MATTFIGPDGYEYSATTSGQDPRSRAPQSTNPFASTLSLLAAMQRQNAADRYASDAYRATRAAEGGLFPMRQDPRKTSRINERRREMNVTEQRGRTAGQRRRDATYREQARARNAAKATARTERDQARADAAAREAYLADLGPSDEMIREEQVIRDMERLANENAAVYENQQMEDRIRNEMIPDAATLRRLDANAAADEIMQRYQADLAAARREMDPGGSGFDPYDPYNDPYEDPNAIDLTGTAAVDMGYNFDAMDAARRRRAAANYDVEMGRTPISMNPDHVAMRQAGAQAAAASPYVNTNPLAVLDTTLSAQDTTGMSEGERARAQMNALAQRSFVFGNDVGLPVGPAIPGLARNPLWGLREFRRLPVPRGIDPAALARHPQVSGAARGFYEGIRPLTQPTAPYGPSVTPHIFGP